MATTRTDFGTFPGLIDGAHLVLRQSLRRRLLHRRMVTAPRLNQIDSRPCWITPDDQAPLTIAAPVAMTCRETLQEKKSDEVLVGTYRLREFPAKIRLWDLGR